MYKIFGYCIISFQRPRTDCSTEFYQSSFKIDSMLTEHILQHTIHCIHQWLEAVPCPPPASSSLNCYSSSYNISSVFFSSHLRRETHFQSIHIHVRTCKGTWLSKPSPINRIFRTHNPRNKIQLSIQYHLLQWT